MLFVFSGLFSLAASLPLKCTTTSFPTDLTGKSCDGLQPAGPAADAAACAAICCAQGEAACSTWNFKHQGGGFPAQCYIGIATHCDATISPKYDGGQRGVPAIPPLAPCPWSGGKFCSMGASAPSKFDYIYPPGDVAAVMYGKNQDRLHLFGGSGGGGGSKATSSSTARCSPRARSTTSSTRATACTPASNDADSDVKMAIVVGERRAAPRARPGSHCASRPPAGARPSEDVEAYSYADDPTFGHCTTTRAARTCRARAPTPSASASRRRSTCWAASSTTATTRVPTCSRSRRRARRATSSSARRRRCRPTSRRRARRCSTAGSTRWAAPTTRRCAPCAPSPPSTAAAGAPSRRRRSLHRRRLRARRRAVRVGPVVRRRRAQGRRVHIRRHAWTDATATTPTPTTASGTHTEPLGPSRQSYVERLAVVPVLLEHGSG